MFFRLKKWFYEKLGICFHEWGKQRDRKYFEEMKLIWKVCEVCNKVKKTNVVIVKPGKKIVRPKDVKGIYKYTRR